MQSLSFERSNVEISCLLYRSENTQKTDEKNVPTCLIDFQAGKITPHFALAMEFGRGSMDPGRLRPRRCLSSVSVGSKRRESV